MFIGHLIFISGGIWCSRFLQNIHDAFSLDVNAFKSNVCDFVHLERAFDYLPCALAHSTLLISVVNAYLEGN